MSLLTDDKLKEFLRGTVTVPVKSGQGDIRYTSIRSFSSAPMNKDITAWWDSTNSQLVVRPDSSHSYRFSPDSYVTTTTTMTTTSTISTTSSTYSTVSTTSSTSSTASTVSTISTTSSSSSTVSTASTLSTTSSTSSTASTVSTVSTTSTMSTVSTISSTSSTASTVSTTSTAPLCIYNEYFDSVDLWGVSGLGSFTSVSGKVRLDIEDGQDLYCMGLYQYEIPSGDFDIKIDLSTYAADDSSNGVTAKFYISSSDGSDVASIAYQSVTTLNEITGTFIYNNIWDIDFSEYPSTRPITLRCKRTGTLLSLYYYTDTWYLLHRKDFGIRCDNLNLILIKIEDNNTRGGYVEFDNLFFTKGCPIGYPKAWSTTSSTSTSSTSTSSSSTVSTSSSTYSTTSTISTTSTTL